MGLEIGILIAAFSAMILWAVGDFLIQRSTRKVGDLEALAFIGIIGTVGLIPLVIINSGSIFSVPNLLLLLILGVVTFAASMVDLEALRRAKLSTTDIIIELELPITVVLGYFFFREGLSTWQFIVISLVFVGIIMVATESFSHWKMKWEKGVIFAFFAAVGMGLVNFLTTVSSRDVSPIMAVWAPWLILTVFCFVLLYRKGDMPKFARNVSRFKWLLLSMGIVDTAAWIAYSLAVLDANIGVITAITESYSAVALFLGVWLNKEKINWHQYFGAFLAISASIVLALFL